MTTTELMPVEEIAARLGKDRRGITKAIERGEMPGRKLGSRYYVNRAAWEAWWASYDAPTEREPTPMRRTG